MEHGIALKIQVVCRSYKRTKRKKKFFLECQRTWYIPLNWISIYLFICLFVCLLLVILSWFVDKQVIHDALKGRLIEEDKVECWPEQIPDSFLDENVDVCLVRHFFSSDAWTFVGDGPQE